MRPIIHWFIDNPIAANLLMIVILVSGGLSFLSIGKEVFPLGDVDNLSITASYSGASPSEIEQQVIIRIEEAIADLDGIDEINSIARESNATITVAVIKGYDTQRLLNNIKTRIDSLTTLPDDVDDVQVREVVARNFLMGIAIYGDVSESILKDTAQWLQQELLLLSAVSNVDLEGDRNREMVIEVSEDTLRRYNLRFDDVAAAIRNNSINLPAGIIKSNAGNLQVQTRGQAFTQDEFANITVMSNESGGQLSLGAIADIRDDFEEADQQANFNGSPVVYLELFTGNPPDIVNASKSTRATLEQLKNQLPQGVKTEVWFDWAVVYSSRMSLLLNNTLMGLGFVFIVLMLFLRPSLASWVCVGIATAILGAFWLMPYAGVTLNMVSMYGFLLALGIIVDDAIVVGESVYFHQRQGLSGKEAAKAGAMWVNKPVVFAVLSTIIFFSVMFSVEGALSVQAIPVATVVIICLFFSLVESLLILPSHLSHAKVEVQSTSTNRLAKVRGFFCRSLESVANNFYRKWLASTLKFNGNSLIVFVMVFAITLSIFIFGGYLKKSFAPIIPSTRVSINAVLPEGASFKDTQQVQAKIEQAAYQLRSDEIMLEINGDGEFIKAIRSSAKNNSVRVDVRLTQENERRVNVIEVKDRWRKLIGPLPGVKELTLRFTINQNRKDLRFRISLPGNDQEKLIDVVSKLRSILLQYQSVQAIEDNLEGSRTEIELHLKPYANALNLSLADIGRQMRQGFYGEEVQRIPRGSDDIKVMLRYPLDERRSVESIKKLYIRTDDGRSVPLLEVANIVEVPGYTQIRRENRRRTVAVTADVIKGVDSLSLANTILNENSDRWKKDYPGLKIEIGGAVADEKEFNSQIIKSFVLAFLLSFGLMAIIFRSCWQPALILTAIPFGFVGAIFGHLLLGQTVTMNSLLGFIACAGVVVNDNLVLLDRIHQLRDQGKSVMEAITQAASDRFRAIILTSLTTFVGLLPILSETSIQAQFMIPMVVSLAFGVLFATVVTLFFVPNLYLLGERVNEYFLNRRS
ncbi:MAG: multidrug efflux pump subunit AcrB [Cellvibrionaceae bacterium]|jgi:multidrug efflux pump subunit AcrB